MYGSDVLNDNELCNSCTMGIKGVLETIHIYADIHGTGSLYYEHLLIRSN